MKYTVIAFTQNGLRLGERIYRFLSSGENQIRLFVKSKYVTIPSESHAKQVTETLSQWAEKWIPGCDGVIFVGASGIAVRTMAPFVKDKRTDPAVVVLDEKGRFSISLLSGHLGGANELAGQLGEAVGAIPVITTATDVNRQFAVDVFAKKNGLLISDMKLAKEVSALILQGKVLYAGMGKGWMKPASERILKELAGVFQFVEQGEKSPDGRQGTFWIQTGENQILHLIPQNMILGIGCRKGTACEAIEQLVLQVLEENGIFREAVKKVCSIDLKKEEQGLLAFCEKWKVPFVTYSSQALQQTEGVFTPSKFVSQVTGVDNICERSAVLGSSQGELLVKKQAGGGVTAACAVEDWSVDFE